MVYYTPENKITSPAHPPVDTTGTAEVINCQPVAKNVEMSAADTEPSPTLRIRGGVSPFHFTGALSLIRGWQNVLASCFHLLCVCWEVSEA